MKKLYRVLCVFGILGALLIILSICVILSAGFFRNTVTFIPKETTDFLHKIKNPESTEAGETRKSSPDSSAGSFGESIFGNETEEKEPSATYPSSSGQTGEDTADPSDPVNGGKESGEERVPAGSREPDPSGDEPGAEESRGAVPGGDETDPGQNLPHTGDPDPDDDRGGNDPTHGGTDDPTHGGTDDPAAHVHRFTETVLKAPTCVREGVKRIMCSCGISRTETIPTAAHSMRFVGSFAPTSSEWGYERRVCAVCGYTEDTPTDPPRADASYTDLCSMNDLRCLPNTTTPDYDVGLQLLLRRASDITHGQPTFMTLGGNCADLFSWVLLNVPSAYRYGLSISSGMQDSPIGYFTISENEEENAFFASEIGKNRAAFEAEDRIISELKIDRTTTQREAVARINEWMCQNLRYDYQNGNADVNEMLISGVGNCSAYARLFNELCHACGINSEYQMGYCDRSSHAWNAIRFSDGTFLYVDVCWNDAQYMMKDGTIVDADVRNGVRESKVREMRTKYLLLSYGEFAPEHQNVYSYIPG